MSCDAVSVLSLLGFVGLGLGAVWKSRQPKPLGPGAATGRVIEQVDKDATKAKDTADSEARDRIDAIAREPDTVARGALPARRARLRERMEKLKGKPR